MDSDYIKRSWVEIDLNQLVDNYSCYRASIPADKEIMAVVKADGYGHGDTVIADCLQSVGVRQFAVSNIDEAIGLRRNRIDGQILILGYTPIEQAPLLQQYTITQALLSEEYALAMSRTGVRFPAQFAIDTGMNRIGLDATDPATCARIIRQYATCFDMNGIFTHLCRADTSDEQSVKFTQRQLQLFRDVAEKIQDLSLPYVHCLNSAGGLWYSDADSRLVRLGIVLYGLKPDFGNRLPDGIAPILTWKTVVSMIKTVRKNETIGYGGTFTATEDMVVATLPTGYADGFPRALSNRGYVLIHGQRAPILGRICMDQLMVDVSNIPRISMGDEVTLIGTDGREMLTADDLANMVGTIGYEIVCGISKRVPRVYKK